MPTTRVWGCKVVPSQLYAVTALPTVLECTHTSPTKTAKSFARARATVPLRPSRSPSSRGQLPVRHPWLPSGGQTSRSAYCRRPPQATGWPPPTLSNLSVHQAHPVHDAHKERPTAAAPRTPRTASDHNAWRRIQRSDGSEDGVPTWAILSQHAATHTDSPTAPSHRWEALTLQHYTLLNTRCITPIV